MRLPLINSSLWYDEAFTWTVSRLPLDRWWLALSGDVHPPLYYAVEWLIARVTDAPWALRLPSVLCGVLSVYLAVQVARALGASVPAQVGTALLMAFIPQQIYYSDELRMYALLCALYLSAVWCVLRGRWGWWSLCLTALIYTHHYGWLYAATLGALALWTHREHWRNILLAGAAPIVVYLPLMPTTLGQVTGVGSFWAALTPDGPPMVLAGWLAGYSFSHPGVTALVIIGALAVLMAATWRAVMRHHWALLWLVWAPLGIGLALALFKNVWLSRGFIGSGALAAVLLAVELTVTSRGRWAALALLGSLLFCASIYDEQRPTVDARFNTPGVSAYLRDNLRPGDVIQAEGAAAWMELQPQRLPAPVVLYEVGNYRDKGGLSPQTREALAPLREAPEGRTWVFYASLTGYEMEPPVSAARLVLSWQSPEKKFHSELYLLEATHGDVGE